MAWKLGAVGALSGGILLGCSGASLGGVQQGAVQRCIEPHGKLLDVEDGPTTTSAAAEGEISDVEVHWLEENCAAMGH